jgi:glycine hydroxymethyltransferase
MKEGEIVEIADFLKRAIIDGEAPESVAKDVKEFRRNFQRVHYAFESVTQAYEYIKIP